jgi:hypothetical protein
MSPSEAGVLARIEQRASRDPGFAGILAVLVDAPTSGAGQYVRVTARELNRLRKDEVVHEFKAGALPTTDVQQLLRLGTPQAVHQLRRRGKLIGLQLGNATWFPAWQFEPGRVRPDLAAILERLARFTGDPIAADRIMRLVRDDIGGRSLSEALKDSEAASTAWTILGSLGA